jgi:hypothetical protein
VCLILCSADAGRWLCQPAVPAAAPAAGAAAASQIHQAAVHRQPGRRGRHAAGRAGTLRQARAAGVLRCIKLDSKLGTLTLLALCAYISATSLQYELQALQPLCQLQRYNCMDVCRSNSRRVMRQTAGAVTNSRKWMRRMNAGDAPPSRVAESRRGDYAASGLQVWCWSK